MKEEEVKRQKAAADSALFDKHFAADVERYAREWSPASAINTMTWNANGLAVPRDVFMSEAAADERDAVHAHALSLVEPLGLSGERGLAAYNIVVDAYASFVKKGTAADSDLDPSSVISADEFARLVSKV